jgi:hypothetical protein
MTMATRRFFLTAGAKIIAASGLLGAAKATAEVEPAGPITPDEWYAEMRRIGWSAVAGVMGGKPFMTIEYGPKDENGELDLDAWRESQPARYRLSKRVNQSGADFFDRTKHWLFDHGLRESL